MMKRIISLMLVLMFVCSFLTPVAAITRASNYLVSYRILVLPQEKGVVQVSATVNATHSNMTRVGFPTINLYEVTGETAKVVKCITSEFNYDAGSHGIRFTYQGVVGKEYYAYASFAAEDSKGGDSRSEFSAAIVAN